MPNENHPNCMSVPDWVISSNKRWRKRDTMTTEIQLHITVSSGDQGSLPNNIIIDCGQLLGVIFGLNFLFHRYVSGVMI